MNAMGNFIFIAVNQKPKKNYTKHLIELYDEHLPSHVYSYLFIFLLLLQHTSLFIYKDDVDLG